MTGNKAIVDDGGPRKILAVGLVGVLLVLNGCG